MWGFQSLKDSFNSHAAGFLRSFTDRAEDGDLRQDSTLSQKDAMKNVVTPSSIPQFTLPPRLNQDIIVAGEHDYHGQDEHDGKTSMSSTPDGLSRRERDRPTQDSKHLSANLKLSPPDQLGANHDEEYTNLKHRKSSGSASSLSIKAMIQWKRSDGKSAQINGRTHHMKSTESNRDIAKSQDSRNADRTAEHPGMSLQHLMATRAGFTTLSESPTTRRKESLFLATNITPAKSPSQDLQYRSISRCGDPRSRSPGSDGNNSSAKSSPRASPMPSPRRIFSKSERIRTFKDKLSADGGNQRRSSSNDETGYFFASDSEDRPASSELGKRRLSRSEQDISQKIDQISTPSIRLCVTYLTQHKRLNVSILEGKNFVTRHSVYLKVTLLPRHDRGHRTDQIKIEDANPRIRERLTFDSVEEVDIPHMSLKICCKEKSSRIRHAEIIGECMLALCDIDYKASNDMWVSLKSYEEEEAPHIQLSLCYDAMLGCLTVDVVAARNIPKGSLGRQQDCFVTLTEILPSAKIAKKQTKIVHRTQDPVFHESFLFSMCTDAQTPDQLVIVATLYVKDRVRGITESVGQASLGQLVDSWSGRSQWAQALANEGEAVTHWHPLIHSQV